jgi:hypothetical protein
MIIITRGFDTLVEKQWVQFWPMFPQSEALLPVVLHCVLPLLIQGDQALLFYPWVAM